MVPASSVRAALRAVEAGTVDAGIVYRTDVRTSTGAVIAFAVPVEDGPAIVYPAAVVRDAPNPGGAARFLDYLQSDGAGSTRRALSACRPATRRPRRRRRERCDPRTYTAHANSARDFRQACGDRLSQGGGAVTGELVQVTGFTGKEGAQ